MCPFFFPNLPFLYPNLGRNNLNTLPSVNVTVGTDAVKILIKNDSHLIGRSLQGGLQIADPQGLFVVKGRQDHLGPGMFG